MPAPTTQTPSNLLKEEYVNVVKLAPARSLARRSVYVLEVGVITGWLVGFLSSATWGVVVGAVAGVLSQYTRWNEAMLFNSRILIVRDNAQRSGLTMRERRVGDLGVLRGWHPWLARWSKQALLVSGASSSAEKLGHILVDQVVSAISVFRDLPGGLVEQRVRLIDRLGNSVELPVGPEFRHIRMWGPALASAVAINEAVTDVHTSPVLAAWAQGLTYEGRPSKS